ncbi:MAG: hypothetical protein MUF49_16670 [Oculatellaceae cyanobacterium Prado106]|nr:hypothetical protein [Oculatellaceae cyanobacterium Prado106]
MAPEAIAEWMQQQQWTDPAVFLPRLMTGLEGMVGEDWIFDPGGVGGEGGRGKGKGERGVLGDSVDGLWHFIEFPLEAQGFPSEAT